METQQTLDEAFDLIVLDHPADDDWMPGEFDIT
jgi:hypothetical protein